MAVGADAKREDRQVDELGQLTDVSHTGTDYAYLYMWNIKRHTKGTY